MMAVQVAEQANVFDASAIKADFPALAQIVNKRPVCYLDSANSAQKPQAVINAMSAVMEQHYANVHRAVYSFGAQTTVAFEGARKKVAQYLNAKSEREIVFTRNATEAINLVANSYGSSLTAGDEIIVSELEHHANIVPWYMLAQRVGVVLRVVPITADGGFDIATYQSLLSDKTKLVALTHMSNALGTVLPVAEITALAHAKGAKVLLDGSQAAVHCAVDVQMIGCDFYVLTGHKMYGPTGIGVLYGKKEWLDAMPPYQGGGEMIDSVAFDNITYKDAPYRFEAGTPPIIEAIGLGAAVDYCSGLDLAAVHAHESALSHAAEERLRALGGVTIYGNAPVRTSIVSFNIDGVHPHDVATIFDQLGVAVRAGHHCAQPLMKALGVAATIRASFALYNTMDDVARLEEAVRKAQELFA